MSRTGILASACALALVFGVTGCDDDSRSGDGGIMLMDSGPPMQDSGPPPMPDTGPPPAMCSVSGLMALPMGCLPRCSMATLQAANMCTTAECQQMAFEADTTPAVAFTAGAQTSMLDCAGCNAWQQQTCVNDSCPSELQAFAQCRQGGGDCTAQQTALNGCIMTNMSALQTCVNTRATGCFSQTAGFLPSAGIQLDAIID